MTLPRKRIKVLQPRVQDELADGIHPLLKRIYLNRGIGNPTQLELGMNRLLSFHTLKGVDLAASMLADAIRDDLHIMIVGDFDADGATSTALAMSALSRLGATKLSYIVPDRFKFGYGLTPEIVDLAKVENPDLIVTVDNGISSIAGIESAHAAGIKVLVTDHHLPGKVIPNADVLVNPNQPGCDFPSKNLAGVGVIFYVMAALRAELRKRAVISDDIVLSDLLDLVALGTVADLVPLDQNNRILVHQGLRRIQHGHCRPGIVALANVAGRELSRLSATDLGYFIGPRLNAAGRLEDMSIGIECLLAQTSDVANVKARLLHDLNAQRRDIQDQMQEDATALVSNFLKFEALPIALCVYDENWHEGVVGLVASRLKERFHRPTIAFAPSGESGVLKGSARSIPGLHIRDALDLLAARHPDLLSKFGGHAMAAGLSIEADNLDAFIRSFNETVSHLLEEDTLEAVIESDGEIAPDDYSMNMAEMIEQGGPWGQQFQQPLFHGRFLVKERRVVGEKHLKLKLSPLGNSMIIDAIAFNAAEMPVRQNGEVLAAYRLDINQYIGRRNLQLIIDYLEA